jgi:uncharacterized membrane protein
LASTGRLARLLAGLVVTGTGLAHFVMPERFDPINERMFPRRPRRYTYINGGIETAIGLTLLSPTPRRQFWVLYVGYPCYLLGNLVRDRSANRLARLYIQRRPLTANFST